jgi:RES domain-containing protein
MERRVLIPSIREYHLSGMHRLISSKYSYSGTVLEDVALSAVDLAHASELDAVSNERVQGELRGLVGISQFELVYGIPNAHIIRAAFLHPGKFGSRFNDSTRGAWYAAEKIETSIAEVSYHRKKNLADVIDPEQPGQIPAEDIATYDDWQADFHGPFHVLEPKEAFAECLEPEPVPQCYQASQAQARYLLTKKSNGVVYPSVRLKARMCLACFRPALVYQPRRDKRYTLHLKAAKGEFTLDVEVEDQEGNKSSTPKLQSLGGGARARKLKRAIQ